MASKALRYWETSAVTQIIAKQEGWEDALEVLEEAKAGVYQAVTAPMTIVEITWRKGTGIATADRKLIEDFFLVSYFRQLDVSYEIGVAAQSLAFDHGLAPFDALHLASAIDAGCAMLYTYDGHLLGCDGKHSGLKICRPVPTKQLVLPTT